MTMHDHNRVVATTEMRVAQHHIEALRAENMRLLEMLADGGALTRPPMEVKIPPELMDAACDEVRKLVAEAFAKSLANMLLTSDPEFRECAACAAKPGSPVLCPSCLHNRAAMARLRERNRVLEDIAREAGLAMEEQS